MTEYSEKTKEAFDALQKKEKDYRSIFSHQLKRLRESIRGNRGFLGRTVDMGKGSETKQRILPFPRYEIEDNFSDTEPTLERSPSDPLPPREGPRHLHDLRELVVRRKAEREANEAAKEIVLDSIKEYKDKQRRQEEEDRKRQRSISISTTLPDFQLSDQDQQYLKEQTDSLEMEENRRKRREGSIKESLMDFVRPFPPDIEYSASELGIQDFLEDKHAEWQRHQERIAKLKSFFIERKNRFVESDRWQQAKYYIGAKVQDIFSQQLERFFSEEKKLKRHIEQASRAVEEAKVFLQQNGENSTSESNKELAHRVLEKLRKFKGDLIVEQTNDSESLNAFDRVYNSLYYKDELGLNKAVIPEDQYRHQLTLSLSSDMLQNAGRLVGRMEDRKETIKQILDQLDRVSAFFDEKSTEVNQNIRKIVRVHLKSSRALGLLNKYLYAIELPKSQEEDRGVPTQLIRQVLLSWEDIDPKAKEVVLAKLAQYPDSLSKHNLDNFKHYVTELKDFDDEVNGSIRRVIEALNEFERTILKLQQDTLFQIEGVLDPVLAESEVES